MSFVPSVHSTPLIEFEEPLSSVSTPSDNQPITRHQAQCLEHKIDQLLSEFSRQEIQWNGFSNIANESTDPEPVKSSDQLLKQKKQKESITNTVPKELLCNQKGISVEEGSPAIILPINFNDKDVSSLPCLQNIENIGTGNDETLPKPLTWETISKMVLPQLLPAKFSNDSSSNPVLFIRSISNLINAHNLDLNIIKIIISGSLTNAAARWWRSACSNITSFQELLSALQAEFVPPQYTNAVLYKIQRLKQFSSESAATFADRVSRAYDQLVYDVDD